MCNKDKMNFTLPETSTNATTLSMEPPKTLNILLYTFGFLVGLLTHSCVIRLIVTGSSGVASEFFNLNLSVCEIGNALNGLIAVLSVHFSSLVALSHFLQGLGITGRPLFQCLICVERYLAVVHPVTFLKYKPLRYRVICGVVAWIITTGFCLCCMIILLSTIVAYPWFFSVQLLVFLSIQLFCLVAVLRALKQSGPGDKRREENHMKKRAFYLILITTVNIAIMYVPLVLTGFLNIMMRQNNVPLWFTALFCYVLAGFVQPLLYLHRAGKLHCFCCL